MGDLENPLPLCWDYDPQVVAQIEAESRELEALEAASAFDSAMISINDRIKRARAARKLYRELVLAQCLIYHEHGNLRVEPLTPLSERQRERVREYRNELSDIVDDCNSGVEPPERQQAPLKAPVPAKESDRRV